MKYNILLFSIFIIALVACTKESDFKAPDTITYTQKKNEYRAVEITGTNTHWGDFTLYLTYDKETLKSIIRTNSQNDTVGRLSMTHEAQWNSDNYILNDYIPSIDQDSIQRLDKQLKEKHGEGNYSLWDSIPKSAETIWDANVYYYTDGRIKKIVVKNYLPNAKSEEVGDDFDYKYILKNKISSTYEYNENSDIIIDRIMYDEYDPTDKDIYERSLYKTEALYDKNKIASFLWFKAEGGENFTEFNRYNYTYNGNQLSAIQGENFSRQFTYNGNQITITTNGIQTSYKLDEHGNVIEMSDDRGNIYKIKYEKGNGNMSIFTLWTDQMINPFFIK